MYSATNFVRDGSGRPVAGVDYPRTFQEMDEWFRSDAGCRDYIHRLRWPDGFACPHCRWTGEPWVTSRGLLHCRGCQGQTSLTAGTVFEGTRKPLRIWFCNGCSGSAARRRGPGSTSCGERWWPHRRCRGSKPMSAAPKRESGAGKPKQRPSSRWRREEGSRQIRLRRVKDVSSDCLLPFVRMPCRPGRWSIPRMEWLSRAGGGRLPAPRHQRRLGTGP